MSRYFFFVLPQGQDEIRTSDGAEGDQGRLHLRIQLGVHRAGGTGTRIGHQPRGANHRGDGDDEIEEKEETQEIPGKH